MDLILATRNKDKVREIKQILGRIPFRILSLADFPEISEIKETGRTFNENAIKKARLVAKKFRSLALADDSGLEVDYLKGAPGIRSARFAGPGAGSYELCSKLLRLMKTVSKKKRKARFVCDAAIATPAGKVFVVEGTCSGSIAFEMRGKNGFGYDPIFIPSGYKKTFAELSPNTKNRISHRAKAFKKAKKVLLAI